MSLIARASVEELEELLDLFSARRLKAAFELRSTKAEICSSVARSRDLSAITVFVKDGLHGCRQHIHITKGEKSAQETFDLIPNTEVLETRKGYVSGLVRQRMDYVVFDPASNQRKTCLWPICIQRIRGFTVLSMTTMDRNPLGDPSLAKVRQRVPDDGVIVECIARASPYVLDLHEGVKACWSKDLIDSVRVKYAGENGSVLHNFNAGRFIKRDDPNLWREIMKRLILESTFLTIEKSSRSGIPFGINPSKGFISFGNFTEDAEREVSIVDAILENTRL